MLAVMKPAPSRLRSLAPFAVVAAALWSTACAAKIDQPAGERRAEVTKAASAEPVRAARAHRGPVVVVLGLARQHGSLDGEQSEAFEQLEAELAEDPAARRALRERLTRGAVAVLRSDAADGAALDRSLSDATSAVTERVSRRAAALEEIHVRLRPEQRGAVARALRVHLEQRFGAPRTASRPKHGARRLVEYLALSRLQLEQLRTLKKELIGERETVHPSREELYGLADAFARDDFAGTLNPLVEHKLDVFASRAKSTAKRADDVLGVFTPEQRELLARLILDGPEKVLLGAPSEGDAAGR
jgi:hypothetical protein